MCICTYAYMFWVCIWLWEGEYKYKMICNRKNKRRYWVSFSIITSLIFWEGVTYIIFSLPNPAEMLKRKIQPSLSSLAPYSSVAGKGSLHVYWVSHSLPHTYTASSLLAGLSLAPLTFLAVKYVWKQEFIIAIFDSNIV